MVEPAWAGLTTVFVDLDVGGEGTFDFELQGYYDPETDEAVALVVRASDSVIVCSGTTEFDDGTYWFEGDRSCLGDATDFTYDAGILWADPARDASTSPHYVDVASTNWGLGSAAVASPRPHTRVEGEDRFQTSVAATQLAFPDPEPGNVPFVLLIRADVFADGIAAGPVRHPTLLVPTCGPLPDVIYNEIQRQDPETVIAIGGTAAICDQVLQDAAARPATEPEEGPVVPAIPGLPGGNPAAEPRQTERVAGNDRIQTAVAVAERFFDCCFGITVAGFDGLVDAVAAGTGSDVVLLVPTCGPLPQGVIDTITSMRGTEVTVAGGTVVVCEAVVEELATLAPTRRAAGGNRFETAAALAQQQGQGNSVIIADGLELPDAVVAGNFSGALLLVGGCDFSPRPTWRGMTRYAPDARVIVMGDTQAVCPDILNDLLGVYGYS